MTIPNKASLGSNVVINIHSTYADSVRADVLVSETGLNALHLKCSVKKNSASSACNIPAMEKVDVNNFNYYWHTAESDTDKGLHHIYVIYWKEDWNKTDKGEDGKYPDLKKDGFLTEAINQADKNKDILGINDEEYIYIGNDEVVLQAVEAERKTINGKDSLVLTVTTDGNGKIDAGDLIIYQSKTIPITSTISLKPTTVANQYKGSIEINSLKEPIKAWALTLEKSNDASLPVDNAKPNTDNPFGSSELIRLPTLIFHAFAQKATPSPQVTGSAKGKKNTLPQPVKATYKSGISGGSGSGAGGTAGSIADQFGWGTLKKALSGLSNTSGKEPVHILGNLLTILVGFVAFAGVGGIIYGGYLYLTAYGSEEKVEKGKKTITYAIIGIILSLLIYVIPIFINDVIGKLPGLPKK